MWQHMASRLISKVYNNNSYKNNTMIIKRYIEDSKNIRLSKTLEMLT